MTHPDQAGSSWSVVSDLPTCRDAATAFGLVNDVEVEWDELDPLGCFLDSSTGNLFFNFDGTASTSQQVGSDYALLMACQLTVNNANTNASASGNGNGNGNGNTDSNTATTTTTTLHPDDVVKCTWSDMYEQTFLPGCTDDGCFEYESYDDAAAACEALGRLNCGGVVAVPVDSDSGSGYSSSKYTGSSSVKEYTDTDTDTYTYQTRTGNTPVASKQDSVSWVFSCGKLSEDFCGPGRFGFTCDELESMQNT